MPSNTFHSFAQLHTGTGNAKDYSVLPNVFFQMDHPSSSVAAVENDRWHLGIIQKKIEVENSSRKHNARLHSSTTLKLTFFYQQEKAKVIKNR